MRKIIKILGDRKIGFILTFAAILGLILGSIVMNFNSGLYPPFFPFDLNFFFNPIRPVHFWLYLLLAVYLVFGGSLLFSTLDTLLDIIDSLKKKNFGRNNTPQVKTKFSPRTLGAFFVHLAILLAMIAHLYEGFGGSSQRMVIGGDENGGAYSRIEQIGKIKINSMNTTYYPDQSMKDSIIQAVFTLEDGTILSKTISYNNPAIFDFGTKEVILEQPRMTIIGITVVNEKMAKKLDLPFMKTVELHKGKLTFQGARQMGKGMNVAYLKWQNEKGEKKELFLMIGRNFTSHNTINIGGQSYKFFNVIEKPTFVALVRFNPSIPLILVSLVFISVGIYFMIRYQFRY